MSYNCKMTEMSTAPATGPQAYEPEVDAQKPDDAPHNTWSSHVESQTSGRSLENEGTEKQRYKRPSTSPAPTR